MRYPPQLLDDIRARLPVSQVVGRKVALKKKGREFAGLSPFKSEKTPSFFVNDHKGFYHCFASGEHGDIFTFLIKTEGLSFPEAVERLAGEAGVPLPKFEARDEAAYDQRQRLYAVLEASVLFFEDNLLSATGTEARRYLERRGLKRETIRTFQLGYAPNSRSALKEHLAKAGFTAEEMTLSGMLIAGDDIPVSYDRFRHRVMFPIADAKGRTIAFGGRALDPEAPAKYLNSPETPLFHKGHNLYNLHRARAPAHDKGRVIAVEGYMDAVALAEAGFAETVAPLGTALTEDQVKLLWRMAPEPTLCFDGDSAGRKAAFRAVDVVLPLVKPGLSLAFAFLPDGLDPDDLVRQQGPSALDAILRAARPLVDVLFEREWAQDTWSTPERRARLDQGLRGLTLRIEDGSVRGHYERELRQRLQAAWGSASGREGARSTGANRWSDRQGSGWTSKNSGTPHRVGGSQSSRPPFNQPGAVIRGNPSTALRKSNLAGGEGASFPDREVLLLRTLLNHPWLADEHAEEIAGLVVTSPALSGLRDAILSAQALENSLDSPTLRSHLTRNGLDRVVGRVDRTSTHKCNKFAEPDAGRTEVEDGWRHALEMHQRQVGLKKMLEAAERAWHEDRSEDAFARILELQQQIERLSTPDTLAGATGDVLRARG